MTLLHPKVEPTHVEELDAEALIREARRLRRRRWIFGLLLGLVVATGAVVFEVSSTRPSDPSAAGANSVQHPYFPGTASEKISVAASASDLLQPVSLAIEANGDLLVADQERNQILLRSPNGRLSVFAGTGQVGHAGDGGEALGARFEGLGAIALSPSGTLYVADSQFGGESPDPRNCHIRAISDGRIRTFVSGICVVSLAISPKGDLYASNAQAIFRISAGGVATKMVVSSPEPQPGYGGSAATFTPCDMAFESNGDLVVDSGYSIQLVSPSGVMTPIDAQMGGACNLDGATTTATGDVVVSLRGGRLQEIVGSRMTPVKTVEADQIEGYRGNGAGDWDVAKIVSGSNGTIYTVAQDQALAENVTQLVEVPSSGSPSVLPISTPLSSTLPKLGSTSFPLSNYPRPVASQGKGLATCPNPSGIEAFDASARARLTSMMAALHKNDLVAELAVADPSWWSGVFTSMDAGTLSLPSNTSTTTVSSVAADPLSTLIATDCGDRLVKDSLVVHYTVTDGVSIKDRFFALDRNGRPYLYLQATGR